MSGYTSGNNAPTLMAQAPNRHGNKSKHPAEHKGGATAVTRPQGNTHFAPGHQGKPAAGGNIATRGQKVSVSRPEAYCTYAHNTAYMDSDRNNFLK